MNTLAETIYISPISWGLGDLIVSLPIVQTLIDKSLPTCLVIRSSLQEGLGTRLEGLQATVREEELPQKMANQKGTYINLREHPLQKNYWWGSPEYYDKFGDRKMNDLLREICTDFGFEVDFNRLVPLKAFKQARFSNTVLFIPGTDGAFKCWPKEYWLQLKEELIKRGHEVLMLGQPESSAAVKEMMDSVNWIETPSLLDCLDLISSSLAVVGVDTGLTHLAVHQGIPAICLYRNRPIYWRPFPHCFKLEAEKPCADECYALALSCRDNHLTSFVEFEPRSWLCARPPQERCMASIDVARALKAFDHLLIKTP
jgi:ADP-heptose:LPS heptosyltransferase